MALSEVDVDMLSVCAVQSAESGSSNNVLFETLSLGTKASRQEEMTELSLTVMQVRAS